MRKINLGCGPKVIKGWENLDLEPGVGGIVCDLRGRLPYEDSSASHIYSEHFLEHLSKGEALFLLKECYRLLKPGGVIRISTPDLRVIARDYLSNRADRFNPVGHSPDSSCDLINESMHSWGHKFLYDFNQLERILSEIGFFKVNRCQWNKSKYHDLEGRETRNSVSDLIIEAEKPNNELRPLISVVMASYNHAPFIGEAIESILNQTFQNFEICITDDFSNDNSVDIIESYRDPRIKLDKLENNMGASFAMNRSLRMSRGAYVAVINSDDVFEPQKLERQIDFLLKNQNFDAVFSDVEFIDEHHNVLSIENANLGNFSQLNYSRQDWLSKLILFGNCLAHPTVLIKRECYYKVGHYDERFRQLPDYDMWIRLLQNSNIHVMNDKLVKFRKHSNGQNESSANADVSRRCRWENIVILEKIMSMTNDDFSHLCKIALPELNSSLYDKEPRENLIYLIGLKFKNQNFIDCSLNLTYSNYPRYGEGGMHQNLKFPSELATRIKCR